MRALLVVLLLGLQSLPAVVSPAVATTPVTLQLRSGHPFQFAGYYVARALGFYADAGLDVTILEAAAGRDPVDDVTSGKAHFGVGTARLLLDRHAGRPVVVLATIFQHSPYVLIARGDDTVPSIHDLKGRRVSIEPDAAELRAYLLREGVALDQVRLLPQAARIADLLEHRTDAISAQVTHEPYLLGAARAPYHLMSPRSAGIDFYGDNLFTSEARIRADRTGVEAFREASLRGWERALRDPEAAIALIRSAHAPDADVGLLRHEAEETAALVRADLVEIGYTYPGRWRHIADVYAELGMLPAAFPLDGFLYAAPETRWLGRAFVGAMAAGAIVAAIAVYILRINRRLRRTLARLDVLRTAVQHSPVSIVITRPDAVIEYVNPQFTAQTGYASGEAVGRTPALLASGLTDRAVYGDMWRALGEGRPWSGEFVNRRKSGDVYWEEARIAPVKGGDGRIAHYVGVLLDVTERIRAREQLAHLAYHDVLTELPNRILFEERLNQSLALARRSGTRIALMMVDVDFFKEINDTCGHGVGDVVLQEIAKRMNACVRGSDSIGRIGGDEFVVLLNDVGDERNALSIAQSIREKMAEPVRAAGRTLKVSLSIGIALFPDHGSDVAELKRCADAAMYESKTRGRDRVSISRQDLPGPIV